MQWNDPWNKLADATHRPQIVSDLGGGMETWVSSRTLNYALNTTKFPSRLQELMISLLSLQNLDWYVTT